VKESGTIKALRIIADLPDFIMTASEFAQFMWPDSPGWTKVSNCGTHGARRGCGMWRAGGSFLAKLEKRGLIWQIRERRYVRIAQKGLDMLEKIDSGNRGER
jgi:hypothetical protein